MKVLIACEFSGIVRDAFIRAGHDAMSCDLVPSESDLGRHYEGDVLEVLNNGWDLVISHPPCTHLAVSGAPWFAKKREDGRQREGIEFFMKFLNANCDKLVVENPIGIISGDYILKHFPDLTEKYGFPIKPTQIIQPWQFGEEFQKSTCLWIKGLPKLEPTDIVGKGEFKEWVDIKTGKSKRQPMWFYEAFLNAKTKEERSAIRSRTFKGIAEAMAEQWG